VLSLSGYFLLDIISSCPFNISLALLLSISFIASISIALVLFTDFSFIAFIFTGFISYLLFLLILAILYLKISIRGIDCYNIFARLLLLSKLGFNCIK